MVYLDQGYETWRKQGRLRSLGDLVDMTVESATLRHTNEIGSLGARTPSAWSRAFASHD